MQLSVRGFLAHGPELWQGRRLHSFELVLGLLAESTLPIMEIITHEFALSDYKQALTALSARGDSGALKVLLRP